MYKLIAILLHPFAYALIMQCCSIVSPYFQPQNMLANGLKQLLFTVEKRSIFLNFARIRFLKFATTYEYRKGSFNRKGNAGLWRR